MVMTEIDVRVCGIPAIAEVMHYWPGKPGRTDGPPDVCYPPEPPELEWRLLDRRGRPAPWLDRKLNNEARARLERDLIEYMEAEEDL